MNYKILFWRTFLVVWTLVFVSIEPGTAQSTSVSSRDELQLELMETIHALHLLEDRLSYEARIHTIEEEFAGKSWTPSEISALCAALNGLTESDQSLLLELLPQNLNEDSAAGPCLQSARARVSEYHQRAQVELLQLSSGAESPQTLRMHRSRLGPSLEREIDPSRGEVFATAGLKDRHVALTFDDGPHPTRTPRLLEILAEQSVHATFFVNGTNVHLHPNVVQMVATSGHTVGNHSHDHWDLAQLDPELAWSNVANGFASIWNAIGPSPLFFRFPYGSRTSDLQSRVIAEGVSTFFWNIDTLDWKLRDPVALYNYVIELLEEKESGIILFHDIQEQTITVMPAVLEYLRNNGYQTVVFRNSTVIP